MYFAINKKNKVDRLRLSNIWSKFRIIKMLVTFLHSFFTNNLIVSDFK